VPRRQDEDGIGHLRVTSLRRWINLHNLGPSEDHLDRYFSGSVAVVIGAGKGIGAAAARLFGAAGASVVLVSRTRRDVDAVAQEIASSGGAALPLMLDIANADAVEDLVRRTMERFGAIHFLVNVVGAIDTLGKPAWAITPEEWGRSVAANISAPFLLCRAIVPVMLDQGFGRILLMTTAAADRPIPNTAAYGSTKAGMVQFIRTLAAELEGSGVAANIFHPGAISTATLDLVQNALRPNVRDGIWKRFSRSPAETAKMILWICSPGMAEVNGEVIYWRDAATKNALAAFGPWLDEQLMRY
jgi:NAD(P)-dependent dehydrogenase (short-subunit alcohol dehydrogenase family)